MAELTKKDIKEAVTEALEPFANAVEQDFKGVDDRFNKVDSRLDKVDGRLDKVDSRLDKLEFDVAEVKSDVKLMKDNFSELFAKLDEFISLYKKQEQELLMLISQMKRLEERVAKLESRGQ